jgi:hypothetical protein
MTHSQCALEDALKVGRDDARERYFEGSEQAADSEPQQATFELADTRSRYKRSRRSWDDRS